MAAIQVECSKKKETTINLLETIIKKQTCAQVPPVQIGNINLYEKTTCALPPTGVAAIQVEWKERKITSNLLEASF